MEHVQPALLGKRARQPGALYPRPQFDDGYPPWNGFRRNGRHYIKGIDNYGDWKLVVQCTICRGQLLSTLYRVFIDHGSIVWIGDDDILGLFTAEP